MATQDSLNLYEMVGAPLMAFVQAEFQATQATIEFIERMGFVKSGTHTQADASPGTGQDNTSEKSGHDELGSLRMATFRHKRRTQDGSSQDYDVQIPVLSLVPIPLMQVKEAELEFNLKVTDIAPVSPSPTAIISNPKASGANGAGRDNQGEEGSGKKDDFLSPNRVQLKTAMSRMAPGETSPRATEAQMRVKMTIEPAEFPTGINHLLQLMNEGVSVSPTLDIDVQPATVAQGDTSRIEVTGGSGVYTFENTTDPSQGSLDPASGDSTTYTAGTKGTGEVTIRVTDTGEDSIVGYAKLTVRQPPDKAESSEEGASGESGQKESRDDTSEETPPEKNQE